MLPGNARGLPSPSRLRISDAIKACANAHHGPTVTAHKTFTRCCTGAHLEPNTGKENKLPTTATAAKIAVTVNFFKFSFFIFHPLFLLCDAPAAFSTIRQRMTVITISGSVFPTGVSTCINMR